MKRRTGETTRIIDRSVQILFTMDSVTIKDTHTSGNAGEYILNKFLKRLEIEHGVTKKDLTINRGLGEVKLKKPLNNLLEIIIINE